MKDRASPDCIVTMRNYLMLAVCSLSLWGCSSGDQMADLRAFMDEVQARPKGQIAPLPEFEPYQPFTYGTSNRRSPFEPPVVIPKETEQYASTSDVQPPINHTKEYLERFSLAALTMVGTLEREGVMFALILDDRGGVHRVQEGDFMGTNWGQIATISDTRIDVVEIVGDGAGGWLRRPRSIELKQ